MALMCMIHGLPSSPASFIHMGILNHLPNLDLASCQRLQRNLRESKLRNMLEVMSLVEKHSTDFEVKCGEETMLVDDPQGGKSIAGSVVALGKFDALHIGHRALAIQASKMGPPALLSFKGMAEVLQWEKRLPIVAPCDRKRIMSLWAPFCGGKAPFEYYLDFAKVRSLSPHDFVERLAKELFVKGVVAGANYRFGYKASGDVTDLIQLCGKFGLNVFIVDPVMDETVKLDGEANKLEKVSSTQVRKALGIGDLRHVTELLGRDHRLVLTIEGVVVEAQTIHASTSDALNQMPMDGSYSAKICLSEDVSNAAKPLSFSNGVVEIDKQHVVVTLSEGNFESGWKRQQVLFLDLQNRISD